MDLVITGLRWDGFPFLNEQVFNIKPPETQQQTPTLETSFMQKKAPEINEV